MSDTSPQPSVLSASDPSTAEEAITWDARTFLELIHPLKGTIACQGLTKRNMRCCERIAKANRDTAEAIVHNLSQQSPDADAMQPELRQLAKVTLCLRVHQYQQDTVCRGWTERIRELVDEFHRTDQESQLEGSSDGGSVDENDKHDNDSLDGSHPDARDRRHQPSNEVTPVHNIDVEARATFDHGYEGDSEETPLRAETRSNHQATTPNSIPDEVPTEVPIAVIFRVNDECIIRPMENLSLENQAMLAGISRPFRQNADILNWLGRVPDGHPWRDRTTSTSKSSSVEAARLQNHSLQSVSDGQNSYLRRYYARWEGGSQPMSISQASSIRGGSDLESLTTPFGTRLVLYDRQRNEDEQQASVHIDATTPDRRSVPPSYPPPSPRPSIYSLSDASPGPSRSPATIIAAGSSPSQIPLPSSRSSTDISSSSASFTATRSPCSQKHVIRKPIEGDCPGCPDPLGGANSSDLVWCKGTCGQSMHKNCLKKWHNVRMEEQVRRMPDATQEEQAPLDRLRATALLCPFWYVYFLRLLII